MSVGMLTGRPEEEMSRTQGDLLQELSLVHERARQAMHQATTGGDPAKVHPAFQHRSPQDPQGDGRGHYLSIL